MNIRPKAVIRTNRVFTALSARYFALNWKAAERVGMVVCELTILLSEGGHLVDLPKLDFPVIDLTAFTLELDLAFFQGLLSLAVGLS